MYRWACDRLEEEPNFEAFRLLYKIRDSTNCFSIGRRDGTVGFVSGAPKLDSPWYKEYFFARPSAKWYSGDLEPPTGYAVGSKETWCASGQFPQSVKDHVARIVDGFQLRVLHSGSESAYQHVRSFYGLRELANANRPKSKKRVGTSAKVGVEASATAAVGKTSSVTAPPTVAVTAAPTVVTRGAGKRPLEAGPPQVPAKHAKTGEPRGKGVRQSEPPRSVEIPPLAATDTEAAELALHTVSDLLVMPSEYTATSRGSNRRLAGVASQFFFSAQIGFSQLIMLNDRLSKTVDQNAVEIAKLKKSAAEGRSALIAEVRADIERSFHERLTKKEQELSSEKEMRRAAEEERDRLQRKLLRAEEIEKTLLEEQESLQKRIDALKQEKTALEQDRETDLAAARAEAGPAYLQSPEFQALDREKYKKIVGDVVAAIRHLFRDDQPEAVWDTDRVWDAIGCWTDADVNSEANEEEGEEDKEAGDAEGGDPGSERSPSV
ncbi:unnamed protein product [Linum trigynum]|uniref:Uncharacterized protein n=1 Tax=Linum trigynum TaxID=586398 RepID=A0AAV2F4H7_9ROSI